MPIRFDDVIDEETIKATTEDRGGDFQPIPPGVYVLRVAEARYKENPELNSETISVGFEVVEPSPKYIGRWIWENFVIVTGGKYSKRHRQQLASLVAATLELGSPKEVLEILNVESVEELAERLNSTLADYTVGAYVSIDETSGRGPRNRVGFFRRASVTEPRIFGSRRRAEPEQQEEEEAIPF